MTHDLGQWSVYERPTRATQPSFLAEKMRFRGWLGLRDALHPTDVWRARKALGLHAPDAHASRPFQEQAYMLCRLEWMHTGEGPQVHPSDKWRLDQDRRCQGEISFYDGVWGWGFV